MRTRTLALVGLALAVVVAACSELPAPNGQGGVGAESLPLIEPQDPPTNLEKGTVPDVIHVQAEKAADAVGRAGFTPVLNDLHLEFSKGGRISTADVICTIEPQAGSTPAKRSAVTLVYDEKCGGSEES